METSELLLKWRSIGTVLLNVRMGVVLSIGNRKCWRWWYDLNYQTYHLLLLVIFVVYVGVASIITFVRWDFVYTFPGSWTEKMRGVFLVISGVFSLLVTVNISIYTRRLD